MLRAHQQPSRHRLPLAVPVAYPVLFALAYMGLLFLGVGVSALSAPRVFLLTALAAAAVSIVANLAMRDRDRGGLLALVVVCVILFGTTTPAVAVLGVATGLLVLERAVSWRRLTRVPWRIVTTVANAVTAIVVITLVITGIQQGGFARVLRDLSPPRAALGDVAAGDLPDVYVILLDGYARGDKLRDLFGYDDPFLAALASRGFDISARSRSNYVQTTLSIPSLLNMRHMNDLIDIRPAGDPDYRAALNSLAGNGDVVRRMRGLGYEFVAIAPGFEEPVMRAADRLVDTGQMNEFELVMARESAVASLISAVAPTFFEDQQRSRILESLEAVGDIAREERDRPRFVFAHIPAPHGPIVFGANGEAVSVAPLDRFYDDTAVGLGLTREEFGQLYIDEVRYLGGRALAAIDAVFDAAPRPPIVLVLSDHGSGSGLDWDRPGGSDLDERTANLFAAFTPDHRHLFPDDITLVNVFGRLFEAYYGITVPRQPDTVYRWNDTNTHLIVASELQHAQ